MALTERYVSVAGSGAHDGTTAGNSFTWAEMLASTENRASKRYNILSGAYTGSTSESFTTSGGAPLVTAPMFIEGYTSSPGDLRGNGRTSFVGPLLLTNYPTLTYTGSGRLTTPDYTNFVCIDETANVNAVALISGTNCKVWRSRVINTNTGNGAGCISDNGNNYLSVNDCDASTAGFGGVAALTIGRGVAANNRITASVSGIELTGLGAVIGNQILDATTGIFLEGVLGIAHSNSLRNISGACFSLVGTDNDLVNNVAWGTGGGSSRFINGNTVSSNYANTNFYGNMGAADVNRGDWLYYNDVALSADPFTSSTDLTLNNTAGGGALVRALAVWKYRDGGAIQGQASAGSAGMQYRNNMSGNV